MDNLMIITLLIQKILNISAFGIKITIFVTVNYNFYSND